MSYLARLDLPGVEKKSPGGCWRSLPPWEGLHLLPGAGGPGPSPLRRLPGLPGGLLCFGVAPGMATSSTVPWLRAWNLASGRPEFESQLRTSQAAMLGRLFNFSRAGFLLCDTRVAVVPASQVLGSFRGLIAGSTQHLTNGCHYDDDREPLPLVS